jgi:hypothetical protein
MKQSEEKMNVRRLLIAKMQMNLSELNEDLVLADEPTLDANSMALIEYCMTSEVGVDFISRCLARMDSLSAHSAAGIGFVIAILDTGYRCGYLQGQRRTTESFANRTDPTKET